MRPPNGACTTSCMPPLSSKKRSSTTRRCVGTAPERLPPGGDVVGELRARRPRAAPAALRAQARRAVGVARAASRKAAISAASSRVRAGASPSQNGIVGGCALRVGDAHDAGLDAQDLPGRVAELEDVAAVRLDREVLVERADERAVGLEEHLVVGGVGNLRRGLGPDVQPAVCDTDFMAGTRAACFDEVSNTGSQRTTSGPAAGASKWNATK